MLTIKGNGIICFLILSIAIAWVFIPGSKFSILTLLYLHNHKPITKAQYSDHFSKRSDSQAYSKVSKTVIYGQRI